MPEQPICPDCKSKSIVFVKKIDGYQCRRCGKEWARAKKEGKR